MSQVYCHKSLILNYLKQDILSMISLYHFKCDCTELPQKLKVIPRNLEYFEFNNPLNQLSKPKAPPMISRAE